MKTNGTRYSPAFKFRVVLETLKAEGKGTEAQVAPACGVHPPALANGRSVSKRRSMEKRMKGRHVSSITHYSSRVTHHEFYYRSPMEYLISEGIVPKTLAESGVKSGSAPGAQARYLTEG